MNKMKDNNPLYRTNGSIDIAGAVRSILAITRTPNKEAPAERYLVQVKSEETAIRVQINAAKLAGQGIFGILQAVANMLQARQYGQQSIQSLNRQSQALASVELNDKTLPYVRRQLKEYSVDFAITKDKDTGQLNLWFKGQDVDRIQTAIENCIAARGKERPTSLLQELSERAMQRTKELNQHRSPPAQERGERL